MTESSDSIERKKYKGFYFIWWFVVTVLLAIGTVSALSKGAGHIALIGVVATVLSALYTRYLYNGGRWRMIFIIF